MIKRRLSSFHLLAVMGWALLSSLLLGCSNYARNYVEPVLEDGTVRARKLLSLKDQRAFDRTYLAAMRQKYLGQEDAAFDLLDAALMINPNDADALYQQGAILLENVYFSDSLLRLRGEQQIQLAQQLAPSNPYYRKQLADYWVDRKLYERALRLYEQVVVDEPTEENFTLLELLQESTAHFDAALQTLDKLQELGGEANGILGRKTKVLELQSRISEIVIRVCCSLTSTFATIILTAPQRSLTTLPRVNPTMSGFRCCDWSIIATKTMYTIMTKL